jgi:hypothetical protein
LGADGIVYFSLMFNVFMFGSASWLTINKQYSFFDHKRPVAVFAEDEFGRLMLSLLGIYPFYIG